MAQGGFLADGGNVKIAAALVPVPLAVSTHYNCLADIVKPHTECLRTIAFQATGVLLE